LRIQGTIERSETSKEVLSVTPTANSTRNVEGLLKGTRRRKRKKMRGKMTMTMKRTTEMKVMARTVLTNGKR